MNTARVKARLDALIAEAQSIREELERAQEDDGTDSPWMTIQEYAAHARVHPDTVRRSFLPAGMPHTGSGRLTRIDRDEADAWRKSR